MKKKFLSMLMAFAIIATLLPMNVFATDGPSMGSITVTNQITDTNGDYVVGAKYKIEKIHGPLDQNGYDDSNIDLFKTFEFTLGVADEDHKVTVTGNQTKINELTEGVYKITQISPAPGYYSMNTGKDDTDKQKPIVVNMPETTEDGTDVNWDVVVNPKVEEIVKDITLMKKDGAGQAVPGATFTVEYSVDGVEEYAPYNENGAGGNTWVTNPEGKIELKGLKYGFYKLVESVAPEGFMLSKEEYVVEVKEDSDNNELVLNQDAVNYKEPGIEKTHEEQSIVPGQIITYNIKVDLPEDIKDYKKLIITDVLPAGLEYKEELAVVQQDGQTSVLDLFDTNYELASKTLTLTAKTEADKLVAGFDGLTELNISFKAKVKPDAIATDVITNKASLNATNKWDTELNKESDGDDITFTAGSIKITKLDGTLTSPTNGEPLAGATFQLYRYNPTTDKFDIKVGDEKTTDDTGVLTWDNLPMTMYKLVEVKAPEGYRKTQAFDTITLKEGEEANYQGEVKNYKKGFMPNTGTLGALGFIAAGAGMFVISKALKKKEEEI